MTHTLDSDARCPFPDAADSLRPYIKTRQEASQIRRQLQSTLPVSSLDITNPRFHANDELNGLTGVRKAYWRALQAHRAAQAKYDDLKSELQQMVQQNGSSSRFFNDSNTFLTEEHLPLMRQREKLRKVQVIETTAAKIKNIGGEVIGESFDKVAKKEVGELPPPPSQSSFSDRDLGFSSEYDLVRLKKAVLTTKQQLDDHQQVVARIKGMGYENIDPHADLRALQKAHNELTTWMETQLALISNAESTKEEAPSSPQLPETNGATPNNPMTEIEDIYELYIGARKRLLETATRSPSNDQEFRAMLDSSSRRTSDIMDTDTRITPSEAVLPYLSRILSSKQVEASLLSQTAFLRKQLSSAEEQEKAMLVRLADESHLVQPQLSRGAPTGKDWAAAASEASATTAKAANHRVQAGKASAETASHALKAIKTMPGSVDTMLS